MGTGAHAAVTPERIMQMAWGYAPPLMMEAAVRHGYFDLLDGGAKTAGEVAAQSGTSLRGARAILNALAGLQLLSKDAQGRFTLAADTAQFLVSTKPGYFGGLVRNLSGSIMGQWSKLAEIAKRGGPETGVNQQETGTEFFHELVEAIFPLSYPAAAGLARSLDVAAAQTTVNVLDLAAGSGVWGIALAHASPHVRFTAVDWPGVLDVTARVAARHGVADRLTCLAGDLLDVDFGSGFQIATLGHILHSEGEPRSRKLLGKVFHALAPGGVIAIQEFLVNEERTGPPMGLIFAVNMLVATENGDTFSFEEISGWLREAGFENCRLQDSPGPSPLILATKPK